MTAELTPAENRAKAAAALARADGVHPGTELYRDLVLTAIARTLSAVAVYLEPLPVPQVPGLPPGYTLDIDQAPAGERKWRYVLTTPGGAQVTPRHLWAEPGTALGEGIRYAVIDNAARTTGSNGSEPGTS
jgi:hypothetical protein